MSPSIEIDVLVVGGGPAGAACATLLARRGTSVAIIEASDFGRFRIGETLQPSIRSRLARLGVPFDDDSGNCYLPAAGVMSVWGQATVGRRPSILNPYGCGWRVNRASFDRMLFEQAGMAGAALFEESRVQLARRHAGWWEFSIVSGGVTTRGRATFVVEATGRKATSSFYPRIPRLWLDRLIGVAIRGDCKCTPEALFPESALVEAVPFGWWYSVYIPGDRALAVFFTDSDLLPRKKMNSCIFLAEQLQQGQFTQRRCPFIKERIESHHWKAFDARSSIRRIAMSDGWAATGDALMAFDPLCGRGVSNALDSGMEVAEWLLSGQIARAGSIPSWIQQAATRFNEYLEQRLRTYSLETRWSDAPFWRRRQSGNSFDLASASAGVDHQESQRRMRVNG